MYLHSFSTFVVLYEVCVDVCVIILATALGGLVPLDRTAVLRWVSHIYRERRNALSSIFLFGVNCLALFLTRYSVVLLFSRRWFPLPGKGQQPQQQLWAGSIYDNVLPASQSSALCREKHLQLFCFQLTLSLPVQTQFPWLCLHSKTLFMCIISTWNLGIKTHIWTRMYSTNAKSKEKEWRKIPTNVDLKYST